VAPTCKRRRDLRWWVAAAASRLPQEPPPIEDASGCHDARLTRPSVSSVGFMKQGDRVVPRRGWGVSDLLKEAGAHRVYHWPTSLLDHRVVLAIAAIAIRRGACCGPMARSTSTIPSMREAEGGAVRQRQARARNRSKPVN